MKENLNITTKTVFSLELTTKEGRHSDDLQILCTHFFIESPLHSLQEFKISFLKFKVDSESLF